MLITALAHDIGKIPASDRMNIGEHPKASVLFLNNINGFKELSQKTAIEEAILN
ncbi:MAG TPA: metal-dependent phosphohydrolase, partial [Methanosarcina sp.]|nr:metal-dependent phosphohydrolase [Methanosarcina sp.]